MPNNLQSAPLTGGFYTARSIIANAQRCVNLVPEANPKDAPFPFTYYPTPGLTVLATPPVAGPARGIYRATNGNIYYMVGVNLYLVGANWSLSLVGTVSVSKTSPVSMQDNGTTMVLVDGSAFGYLVDLASNTFTSYSDPSFVGSDRVDYLDSFMLFNQPNSRNFYSTLSNTTTIDPTFIAAKTGYPDLLQTLIVMHREIWLLGTQKSSEIWYDAGSVGFPFALIPGVYIEQGCAAKYSLARHDLAIFWLGMNADGQAIVIMGENYKATRISTHAIEQELSTYASVSDAVGMVYQQKGHIFYVITFPSADKTWVFDRSQDTWHEWMYSDSDGNEHRHRASCMAFANNVNLAGDWQNGTLYALDNNNYTDNGQPIVRRRSWPHMQANGGRVEYLQFLAEMEVGTDPDSAIVNGLGRPVESERVRITEVPDTRIIDTTLALRGTSTFTNGITLTPQGPNITLRWSDTRGASWNNGVMQSLGATGQYLTQPQWMRLGIARDRVFELSWSAPVRTALNGAYITMLPLDS